LKEWDSIRVTLLTNCSVVSSIVCGEDAVDVWILSIDADNVARRLYVGFSEGCHVQVVSYACVGSVLVDRRMIGWDGNAEKMFSH
jgi:hypothetical protein